MESVIRRGLRFGYCTTNQAPLAELVAEADETLFKNILHIKQHVLHQLLPNRTQSTYNLRSRKHDCSLTVKHSVVTMDHIGNGHLGIKWSLTWSMTSGDTERSRSWPQWLMLRAHLENGCRYILGDNRAPIGNGYLGIKWSRDRWRCMTLKVKVVIPKCFVPIISKTAGDTDLVAMEHL